MAQASLLRHGWNFEVERGPDWLFVRPHKLKSRAPNEPPFAEQVWALLEQHLTHRLVLEMRDVDEVDAELADQFVWLYKRIHTHDGIMRVCELSPGCEEVLHACASEGHFGHYCNREEAVMGQPRQPR
jgi:anti-sigma B factor antagonist